MTPTHASQPKYQSDPPRIDFAGQKFGRLTVLHFAGWKPVKYRNTTRLPMWVCQCDCGKIVEVRAHIFRRQRKMLSCGCYRSEVSRSLCLSRAKAPGVSFRNHVMARVKAGAKRRGIPFELSTDQVIDTMIKPCFYCNRPPQLQRKASNQTVDSYRFPTNTIDRLNNQRGYHIDNVVSCCFDCNLMKGTRTIAEFLEHVKQIYQWTESNV